MVKRQETWTRHFVTTGVQMAKEQFIPVTNELVTNELLVTGSLVTRETKLRP